MPWAARSSMNRVVATLGQVVEVLDADNLRDRLRLGQLPGRNCAEADMLNQTLLLEFSERGERLFERLVFRSGESAEPEIHNLERIEAQVAQIVVYGVDDLLARACVKPGTVGAAACADFGHDDQIIRIRMQRLLDDLIGHMRTVVIAGIDVVHARRHSLAQEPRSRREYRAAGPRPPCRHPVRQAASPRNPSDSQSAKCP